MWNDITEQEIIDIIRNLNPRKAPGHDEVSVVLIKKLIYLIAPILCSLFNQSFYAGTYPNYLKIAKVISLYKSGAKTDPGNYRPISLLSIINKIYEKAIYSRIYRFLEKNKLINSSQFGFRQGHSTEMAISEFYEKVLKSQDQGKATCAVLLDLAKAFDSVDRAIVLHKLYKYGLRGNILKLMSSYLENRKQFVYNGVLNSDLADVDVGVPQGAVLGPLLFILHINDMRFSTELEVLNFADDTLLYMCFKNPQDMEEKLNIELEKVNKWLCINRLKVNSSKTKFMLFRPRSQVWGNMDTLKLKIGQSANLEQVEQYKYLGLIIDSKLTWEPHVKYICSKLSKTLGVLFRTRYCLNRHSLFLIFNSLFLSYIRYGIICWGRCTKATMKPLVVMMNRAIRCILFLDNRETCTEFFAKNNILHIQDLFKLEVAKFMFRYNNNLLPTNFDNYFIKSNKIHSHNTRFSLHNFQIPNKKSNKGLQSLGYLGAKIWSKTPEAIKIQTSVHAFTRSYKSMLFKTYC